jgi:integral membrane protein (TIGR01906 family)
MVAIDPERGGDPMGLQGHHEHRNSGPTMRVIEPLSRWLFILSLPLLFLSAAFRIPASSALMYEVLFDKYDVGFTTGLDEAGLRTAANGLVRYFNSNAEHISLVVTRNGEPFTLFNEREVVHLKDVKGLFEFDRNVLLVTSGVALLHAALCLVRKATAWRRLAGAAFTGSCITIALMVGAGIGMTFNFDGLLLQFHLFSFANDFWLLDPRTDYLIMLITQGFMYDASFIVAGAAALGALLVGGASGVYLLQQRRRGQGTA